MEQMLSRPPQATLVPDGEKAHVMTHEERSGIACCLFPLAAFHTISLPSCEALTSHRLVCVSSEAHQCIA